MRTIGIFFVLFTLFRAASGDIWIRFIKPVRNQLSGTPLTIIVNIQSTFQLQTVKANVEDQEVELAFSSPNWAGEISLSGFTKGPHTLSVTAEDVLGGSASSEVVFIFNEKPTMTVEEPLSESVATPLIHVRVSCSDDDDVEPSMQVKVIGDGQPPVVASGGELIDQTIDLLDFDHLKRTLRFEAVDSAGQVTSEDRSVYVESNPRLVHFCSVRGRIWDAHPDRILHLEGDVLRIRDLASGEDTEVLSGQTPKYGFLAPKGAIFVEQSGTALTAQVIEFRDGQLNYLGYPNSSASLKVSGNYAIWNADPTLLLRDLLSGASTLVANNSANWKNDVTANGEVAYWSSPGYQVFLYKEGSATQLTNDVGLRNVYPLTDGTNVVYHKLNLDMGTYAIAMHDPSGETILAEPTSQQPQPGSDYIVNNGWVAFTKLDTFDQLQVWTRSPSGELAQRSFSGTSSYIEALNPDGELIFVTLTENYLSLPGQGFSGLGRWRGNAFWQDGQWLVAIGRSLFSVDTGPQSISLTNPSTNPAGEFCFEIHAKNTATVTIQASSDFKTWRNIGTENLWSGVVTFADVNTKSLLNRFYRAKTF